MEHPRTAIMSVEDTSDFWNRTEVLRRIAYEASRTEVSAWGLLAALQVNALSHLPAHVVPPPLQASTIESLDLFVALVDEPAVPEAPTIRSAADRLLPPLTRPCDTSEMPISEHLGLRKSDGPRTVVLHGDINDLDVSGTMNTLARGESATVSTPDDGTLTRLRREAWRLGAAIRVPCKNTSALPRPTSGWLWALSGEFRQADVLPAKPASARRVRLGMPAGVAHDRKHIELPSEGRSALVSAVATGELDYFRLHTRMAAATAALHGRVDPTSDDWRTARLQLRVSNATRRWWVDTYGSYRTVFDAVTSVSSDPDVIAVANTLLELIAENEPYGRRNSALRRRLTAARQGRVPAALKLLTRQGLIVKDADKSYHLA